MNIVLTVIAYLLVVAGIVLCVLFGIGQVIIEDVAIVVELYVGLGCIGFGLLLLVGCNIAVNARITADNSYDTLRHVEMLCQKEGISLEDLARKDAKIAEKKVMLEAKTKLKLEKEARAKAEAQVAEVNELLRIQQESNAQAQLQLDELQAKLATAPEAVETPAVEEAPQAAEEEVAAAPVEQEVAPAEAPAVERNVGISLEEWKAELGEKGTCGACGAVLVPRANKSGRVGLVCKNNGKGGCSEKPMFVEDFATRFVNWYNSIYPEQIQTFQMDKFAATVDTFQVQDGDVRFVGK